MGIFSPEEIFLTRTKYLRRFETVVTILSSNDDKHLHIISHNPSVGTCSADAREFAISVYDRADRKGGIKHLVSSRWCQLVPGSMSLKPRSWVDDKLPIGSPCVGCGHEGVFSESQEAF
jgi:hypothetical protein